ncbi:MAG: EAL domain-containing protein, partial [Pseudomonadota bacterium]
DFAVHPRATAQGPAHGAGHAGARPSAMPIAASRSDNRDALNDDEQIVAELITALGADALFLNLQPIVDAKTRQPAFFEGLLRMQAAADGQPISCSRAILNAERSGLIKLVDCRTLDLAGDVMRRYPTTQLAVNLSAATVADPNWTAQFQALATHEPELVSRLIVELTETAQFADLDTTISFVDFLRDAGARVAIDDFGAGYNSLLQMKHLGVDIAKIDGAFTPTRGANARDFVFVRRLMELAHDLGIETVAEHVSDTDTADQLTELGVTYLQGFEFGYPADVDDVLGAPDTALRA